MLILHQTKSAVEGRRSQRPFSKEPAEVTSSDVLAFITAQRATRSDGKIVRLVGGESGLSMQTIKRRLSSVSGLFSYLALRGDAGVAANPVPRGLATRNARLRGGRGVPLVRAPHRLPRILEPDEVDELMEALRRQRAPGPQLLEVRYVRVAYLCRRAWPSAPRQVWGAQADASDGCAGRR